MIESRTVTPILQVALMRHEARKLGSLEHRVRLVHLIESMACIVVQKS